MDAESRRGTEVRNILIDFGYQSETLLNNMSYREVEHANAADPLLSGALRGA